VRGAQIAARMLARASEEQIPLSASLAMTHRCQLRCLHCYLGDERFEKPDKEQPTQFWTALLDQMAQAGCLDVLITGGEPLVRTDFARVYEHTKRLGMLAMIFTNATLVDDRLADLFADLPPEMIEVSLYGATERVYESVTGIKGSFRRCLDGVDLLLQRGVRVGLKTVILTDNVHEVEAMRALASGRGVPFRVDPAVFPCRDGDQAPLEHRIGADEAARIEMADEGLRVETARAFAKTREVAPTESLFPCMAGLTGFHVDPNGMLFPCMMVTSDGYDLTRGSLAEGWREAMPRFRAQTSPAGYDCRECGLRLLCGACHGDGKPSPEGGLHVRAWCGATATDTEGADERVGPCAFVPVCRGPARYLRPVSPTPPV
jgi:radical SAM protein with 4Fe4S-binding SPASM domain